MRNDDSIFAEDAWVRRGGGKILAYMGRPLKDGLNREVASKFVREKGALGAMWTYDHGYCDEGPWYRCICDSADYDIDKITGKTARNCTRRGIKECDVRPIDYVWLGDNGYEVYINAVSRYTNFKPVSKETFRKEMYKHSGEPGREALGVFINEKLVAYTTLLVCDETVRVCGSKFDPAYSKAFPMYALYYTIAHHYLKEKGYKEVDNGTRPLLHETDISDFLLRLGWRKDYGRLGIYLTRPVRAVLSIARIFSKVCKFLLPSRYYAILESLLLAQDIANATSKH